MTQTEKLIHRYRTVSPIVRNEPTNCCQIKGIRICIAKETKNY